MNLKKVLALLRYLAVVTTVSLILIVLVEAVAVIIVPTRYQDPPPVTTADWIYSDALSPRDTTWMKQFVGEFLRSYDSEWTSYVYFKRKPFTGTCINVDSNGIRFTPQFSHASVGAFRPVQVVLLGGSTMWGTCARDSGTIPSALARVISEDGSASSGHVVNMGESGYVSTQDVLRLELELRKGHVPDVVILYDGVNDVFSAYQNNEPGLPQNEVHRSLEFNLLKDGGKMRKLGWEDLLNRTVTAELLTSVRTLFSQPPPPAPTHLETAAGVVRLYRGNLEIVEGLSKQYGFQFEAYWQPVVFSKRSPSPYEQKQSAKVQYIRPLFQDVYRRVAQDSILRHNPHFHNISEIFDNPERLVFLDFCHITEAGNSAIAGRIYADIRQYLRQPFSPL